MSEEKRMPVLTGQKKQIFYTGLVYLLVCFMTAGVTVFLTKEKKDEVKEVRRGFECGLVMESYNDIKEGDQIESFIMEEVPR